MLAECRSCLLFAVVVFVAVFALEFVHSVSFELAFVLSVFELVVWVLSACSSLCLSLFPKKGATQAKGESACRVCVRACVSAGVSVCREHAEMCFASEGTNSNTTSSTLANFQVLGRLAVFAVEFVVLVLEQTENQ